MGDWRVATLKRSSVLFSFIHSFIHTRTLCVLSCLFFGCDKRAAEYKTKMSDVLGPHSFHMSSEYRRFGSVFIAGA